ncbi:ABC transporter ATP-binding protein [Hippea maritima]|uniref:Iron-chelate-transporting ATPase n=1 Tax=Hippea maritima (strain ATCC 700847 / DSM 10411 / MH2) TaxID=760142 RepID=F2LWK4_HIPMA|nr:ATP-binding cassette domain-containing protein [Hippea maritima]AEA34113.1 Iron-chelate-transporting ATPase [Hippea maritima DSM 10411]
MIEVESVCFTYGNKRVLENISFIVENGSFFCIAGPNGAGKSTLVKIVGRALRPSCGLVKLKSKDIWSFDAKSFAKAVAMIPQSPFYNFLRIREFVLTGRIPHFSVFQFRQTKKDKEAVDTALSLCGLDGLADEFMHKISGGERQLVFLARALASNPEVLIMDEPLSNLDINNQEKILYLLKYLKVKFGLTIVGVLHDLNIVSEFADRVLVLKDGQVKALGKPSEVINGELINKVYGAKNVEVFKKPQNSNPFVYIANI